MNGRCLCGKIRFSTTQQAEGFAACHCTQCRKQSGHFWASAHVQDDALLIDGEVRWYHSSDQAKRGFCPVCGSFLFWKHEKDPHTSFSLGAIEGPTERRLAKHIFTASQGDYYDITDGLPQS